jgi:hypothetical protein
VASLYIRGKSQVEIAADVGVSQSTVCNDLNEVRRLWKASAMVDFDAKKEEQLAKIDEVEKKAWEAWERSCEDAEVRHRRREFIRVEVKSKSGRKTKGRGKVGGAHKMVPVKGVSEFTARGQVGDPRFLDQVMRCVETRVRILGLAAVEEKKPKGLDWDLLTRELAAPIPDAIEMRLSEGDIEVGPGGAVADSTPAADSLPLPTPPPSPQENGARPPPNGRTGGNGEGVP